jgi:hypothetical protein
LFTGKYPDYVSGDNIGAEVNVSQEQLDNTVEASINLVGWLAKELRAMELSSIKKQKDGAS